MAGQCVAVVSGKGGTGKTSFTAGVGSALAQMGQKVLCVDCDVALRNLDDGPPGGIQLLIAVHGLHGQELAPRLHQGQAQSPPSRTPPRRQGSTSWTAPPCWPWRTSGGKPWWTWGRRGSGFLLLVEAVQGFYQAEDHKGHDEEVQNCLDKVAVGDHGGADVQRQLGKRGTKS